MPNVFLVL